MGRSRVGQDSQNGGGANLRICSSASVGVIVETALAAHGQPPDAIHDLPGIRCGISTVIKEESLGKQRVLLPLAVGFAGVDGIIARQFQTSHHGITIVQDQSSRNHGLPVALPEGNGAGAGSHVSGTRPTDSGERIRGADSVVLECCRVGGGDGGGAGTSGIRTANAKRCNLLGRTNEFAGQNFIILHHLLNLGNLTAKVIR